MKWPRSFLIVLVFYPTISWACEKPVDDKKIVFFINVNGSVNEVSHAAKAACDTGKRFEVIPSGEIPVPKDLIRQRDELQASYEEFYNNMYQRIENGEDRNTVAREAEAEFERISQEYSAITRRIQEISGFTDEELKNTIKGFAQEGAAIDTLIASGHDGGGSISGTAGSINKYQLTQLINEAYEDKPELLREFKNIMLWGCYTTTKAEVAYWKHNFPNLNLITGFLGSAPADDKEASYTILADLIRKSEKLGNLDDDANIKREIKRIENLVYTLPGIFIDTGRCDLHGFYYGRNSEDDGNGGTVFVTDIGEYTIGNEDCSGNTEDIAVARRAVSDFYSGNYEIPADTRSGPLRHLYGVIRSFEHCLEGSGISGDLVGKLLFYEGVVDNFLNTFRTEVAEMKQMGDYNEAIREDINRKRMALEGQLALLDAENTQEIARLNEEVAALRVLEQDLMNVETSVRGFSFDANDESNLRTRLKLSASLAIHQRMKDMIGSITNQTGLSMEDFPNFNRSDRFFDKAKDHLWNLESNCIDFLEWHELVPGRTARSNCQG